MFDKFWNVPVLWSLWLPLQFPFTFSFPFPLYKQRARAMGERNLRWVGEAERFRKLLEWKGWIRNKSAQIKFLTDSSHSNNFLGLLPFPSTSLLLITRPFYCPSCSCFVWEIEEEEGKGVRVVGSYGYERIGKNEHQQEPSCSSRNPSFQWFPTVQLFP